MTPDRLSEIEEKRQRAERQDINANLPVMCEEDGEAMDFVGADAVDLVAALREAWDAMEDVEKSIELELMNPNRDGLNKGGLRVLFDILKAGRPQ